MATFITKYSKIPSEVGDDNLRNKIFFYCKKLPSPLIYFLKVFCTLRLWWSSQLWHHPHAGKPSCLRGLSRFSGGIFSSPTSTCARSFVLVQVTPLDLVKCRLQVDKEKYKSLGNGFKLTVAEQGVRGLFLGWAPTAIGYSMQGLCKFGFYEFFKNTYSNMIGEENTYLYKTSLYLAASASAEFFADIALSPMEAVKVKMQTSKLGTFPTTLRSAAPTLYRAEGLNGRIQLISCP